MEIHPTFIIITGLVLDVIGAIFIVFPLVTLINRTWGTLNPEKEKTRTDMLGAFRDDNRIQILARIGIFLLSVGFIIQIIGNWLQNTPSFDV